MTSHMTTFTSDGLELEKMVITISHVQDVELESASRRRGFSPEATKKLIRKMDWNIVPFLALLYLQVFAAPPPSLSFLDRSNIGNARLAGLEKDLGMHGLEYNIALAVFFPFYVLAEVPSNMMMKRTRPSLWISIIMIAWGVCMTLMGLVKNYKGLLISRMALGFAEGGLFPGVTFYITLWYARHECGLRMALFFSAATMAGAFGGLLARGIVEMDGLGGLNGWAWIFILEGLATIIAAAVAYFMINDYPQTAKFLTSDEKAEVQRRLKADRSSLADEFDLRYFFDAVKDWKIYVYMVIAIGVYTPLYSFSLFLPTIVKNMGYTDSTSQLMTVPPYIVACMFTIGIGYLADLHRQRGVCMALSSVLGSIGFLFLLSSPRPQIQYCGTFFAACGVYPCIPMITAWTGNNIGGSTKRGVAIAMQVGFGNLGGVVAAFSYRYTDAPRYVSGHALLVGTCLLSAAGSACLSVYLRRENRRRDAVMRENNRSVEGLTEHEMEEERGRGDYASFFRYTV
ncbi:major facilitator superfamily domain-containing protein [Tricharina praecox]|uniref:major facilitator superfamily domain-containing protein n=1 Tax=Tricharina praecox TaxID=43433 RepID=UPI002220605B|nr:major facilitator superfamily domain-containing protein [Tricharina praecox]KAI5857837.1 major facilitator superfamily domain-containing protein [Tricharina praecox]